MHELLTELFPLNRSLTGDGVRETLRRLAPLAPLEMHEVPSGTRVLDWVVPREWNVNEAYIETPDGRRIADFARSNLHLVGYSAPFRGRVSLPELRAHLHTLPEQPDRIPYRTSYFEESWGFCLAQRELEELSEGAYEVVVDTRLDEGSLTFGECLLEGESDDEVLISSHVCHPSLANDNLSGVVVAAHLANVLAELPRRLSVRFLFAPATIGAIAWLARRSPEQLARIRHGLVLTCLGDPGPLTYKRSRRGNAAVDRAASNVVAHASPSGSVRAFSPLGYDERQFCSPGFDLPIGRLTRTPDGEYPEYHTSADDPTFVDASSLEGSLAAVLEILEVLERDRAVTGTAPFGEPQLGRRGLYRSLGGEPEIPRLQEALLWVLNLADGRHSLLDIAERAGFPFRLADRAAGLLSQHGLLADAARPPEPSAIGERSGRE